MVFVPAMKIARGLPRLRAMFERLARLDRSAEPARRLLDDLGGATEYRRQARAGARRVIADGQPPWNAISQKARPPGDRGRPPQPPDTDPEQIGFEMLGIVLASHNHRRLLGYREARKRALTAFDELISRHAMPARSQLAAPAQLPANRKEAAMSAAFSLSRISTNVRFSASALLFPELAGAWAERMFLTPPRARDAAATALDLIDARSSLARAQGPPHRDVALGLARRARGAARARLGRQRRADARRSSSRCCRPATASSPTTSRRTASPKASSPACPTSPTCWPRSRGTTAASRR